MGNTKYTVYMKFDSFLVIDDDNKEHIVKINFTIQKYPSCRHPRKIITSYEDAEYPEVSFNTIKLFKRSDKDYLAEEKRNRDSHRHCGATNDQIKRYNKKWTYKGRKRYSGRKKYRNIETNQYFYTTISKSTIKRLKAVLAKHGQYSFKVHIGKRLTDTHAILKVYDENVLKHLYFYNTDTKERYRLDEYVNIASLAGDLKEYVCDHNIAIDTHDIIFDYKHPIDYKAYFINLLPSEKDKTTVIRFDRFFEFED